MKKVSNYALLSLLFFVLTHTNAFAIPIGPDKYYIDLTTNTDEIINKELTIYGKEDLDTEQQLYFSVVGMKKIGEEHEREFYIPNSSDLSEPANWIELEITEGVIQPGSTIIIPWKLTPPTEKACGTKLAAIMVSNLPQDSYKNSTTITVKKEIISQIHVTQTDTQTEECRSNVQTESFVVARKIPLFNYDNVPFSTTLTNDGNYISRSPKGFIEIFGLGDKVTIDFNKENLDIYPDSSRKFSDTWIDEEYPHEGNFFEKLGYELTHLRFGKYEARLGVTKNVSQDIIAYDSFWIIPWRVILTLLVIIFGTNRLLALKTTKNKKPQID